MRAIKGGVYTSIGYLRTSIVSSGNILLNWAITPGFAFESRPEAQGSHGSCSTRLRTGLINRGITGTDLLQYLDLLFGTQSDISAVSGLRTERDHWT